MFDLYKFYNKVRNRANYFDDYWDEFPKGRLLRFKEQTLSLLKENVKNKNKEGIAVTVAILWWDGADRDYTDLLLQLLDEQWHTAEEDIVSVLEIIKDPKSVDKLYEVAINVPDYDEMCALANKCIRALGAIATPEAIEKLKLLQHSDEIIIRENASSRLNQILNKN